MSAATGLTFIASPMGIAAECRTLQRVMLLWWILPGSGIPLSALKLMHQRLLAQIRAHQKLGTAAMFEDLDIELKQRIDSLIKELENRIARAIASDDHLSETATALRSIPGIGPVTSTMLIAEMPEIGTITGEEEAALTGLAPVADDSGTLRGKRAIAGGRQSS
ncbi:IS110 family transposase, partial [Thioclava sp. BHET1]